MAANTDDKNKMTHAHDHTHDNDHEHTHDHGHHHSHENTRAVVNRLNRAIGHLEAVRNMVEDGRDCLSLIHISEPTRH